MTVIVTVRTVERPVFGFTVMVTRQVPRFRPRTVVPTTLHREDVEALTRRLILDPVFTVIFASRATDEPVNVLPSFTLEGIVVVVGGTVVEVVVVSGTVVVVAPEVPTEVDVTATVVVVVLDVVVVVASADTPPRVTTPTVDGSSSSPMVVVLL
ncbi:MAG: hypothetical protein ACKOQ1_00275 [Actinomycetota bacterium]